MFVTKRRLIATLLVVRFLVASLGMYTEPAHASGSDSACEMLLDVCNTLSTLANTICDNLGNSSQECLTARGVAWLACYLHYVVCGGG